MSYYVRQWMQWTDRIVVVVAVACLLVGMSVAQAQTAVPPDDGRIVRDPPLIAGTLFDGMATIWWSPKMVVDRVPPKAQRVFVVTYVNTPDGPREVYLEAWLPVQPKGAAQ